MEAGIRSPLLGGQSFPLLGASLLAFMAEPSRPAPWGDRPQGTPGIRQDPTVGSVVSGTLCRSKRVSWIAILTPFPRVGLGGLGRHRAADSCGSEILCEHQLLPPAPRLLSLSVIWRRSCSQPQRSPHLRRRGRKRYGGGAEGGSARRIEGLCVSMWATWKRQVQRPRGSEPIESPVLGESALPSETPRTGPWRLGRWPRRSHSSAASGSPPPCLLCSH